MKMLHLSLSWVFQEMDENHASKRQSSVPIISTDWASPHTIVAGKRDGVTLKMYRSRLRKMSSFGKRFQETIQL